MALNVFELEAILRLNKSEYEQSLGAAEKDAKSLSDSLVAAGGKIQTAGYGLESISRPARNLVKETIGLAQEWEYGIAKVSAISGVTGEEMDAVKNKAAEVAAKTKWTMSEAAEALNYMAMAGWKDQQMIGGLEPIMLLAAATGSELGRTSDIVTDAMTAFGMRAGETATVLKNGVEVEMENTARFADVLAAAASNSNTNVDMLGESFKYAAPVAGAMGYSIEDVAVALGLMADTGVKASMGGTALRTTLTNLAKPTKNVNAALDQLGLSQEDLIGEGISLRDIMEKLRGAFAGGQLSAEEYTTRLADIEARAESGELTLGEYETALKDLDEKYAEGKITSSEYEASMAEIEEQYKNGELSCGTYTVELDKLNTEMYGVESSNKAALAAMIAGKYGMAGFLSIVNASEEEWEKLTGAIDGSTDATKNMYETMMGTTEGASARFDSALNVLKTSLGETLLPMVTSLMEKLTELVNWFNSLDDGTKKTIMLVTGVVGVLGPALIIIGKVVSAIGIIGHGISGLIGLIGGIGSAVPAAASAIGGIGTAAAGAAGAGGLAGLAAAAGPFLAGGAIVAGIGFGVYEIVKHWDDICDAASAVGSWVGEQWGNLCDTTAEIWGNITSGISDAWNSITTGAMDALSGLGGILMDGWEALSDGASKAWEGITGVVSGAWDGITSFTSDAVSGLGSILSDGWDALKHGASIAWDGITGAIGGAWDGITSLCSNAMSGLGNLMSSAWEGIKSAASSAWSGIQGIIGSAWDGLKGLGSKALEWGGDLVSGLASGIKGGASAVMDGVSWVANGIASFLHFSEPDVGPLSDFHTWMPDMMSQMADGITSNLGLVVGATAEVADGVNGQFDDIMQGAENLGMDVKNTLATGFAKATNAAMDSMEQMKANTQDVFNQALQSASEWSTGVSNSMDEMKTNTRNMVEESITVIDNWQTSVVGAVNRTGDDVAGSMSTMKNSVNNEFQTIKRDAEDASKNVQNIVTGTFSYTSSDASNSMNNLKGESNNAMQEMMSTSDTMANAFSSAMAKAGAAMANLASMMSSMASQAKSWGADMADGIANGMTSRMGVISRSAQSCANEISSYLHFSVPDEGPLADADTYMPDMMQLFAKGIKDNEKVVTDQIAQSFDFSDAFVAPAAGAGTGGVPAGGITINVYGAAGQDVNTLAEIIEQKLSFMMKRRGVAFA